MGVVRTAGHDGGVAGVFRERCRGQRAKRFGVAVCAFDLLCQAWFGAHDDAAAVAAQRGGGGSGEQQHPALYGGERGFYGGFDTEHGFVRIAGAYDRSCRRGSGIAGDDDGVAAGAYQHVRAVAGERGYLLPRTPAVRAVGAVVEIQIPGAGERAAAGGEHGQPAHAAVEQTYKHITDIFRICLPGENHSMFMARQTTAAASRTSRSMSLGVTMSDSNPSSSPPASRIMVDA